MGKLQETRFQGRHRPTALQGLGRARPGGAGCSDMKGQIEEGRCWAEC